MHLDVATGGEYARGPGRRRARRPARAARQQQVAPTSCAAPWPTGVGPHRGRLASTSSTASRRCVAEGLPAPQVLLRVTPGRRGPHPRVRPHRPGRLQVRLRPRHRATPTGRRAGAGLAGGRAGGPARPHRLPGVRGRLLRAGGRGAGPVRAAPRPARAVGRRRARAWPTSRARRPRRSPSGARRSARPARAAGITATGHRRAGPGHRGRGRGHRSTPSARSRTCPASAPTWPSTAA